MKFLEEVAWGRLQLTTVGDILDRITIAQGRKIKQNKQEINLEFSVQQAPINKIERHPIKWDKRFGASGPNKELRCTIYQQEQQQIGNSD